MPYRFMIVCICYRVSDREIARHADAGLTFEDIQFALGVATQCGQCESCARDVIAGCASAAVDSLGSARGQIHTVQISTAMVRNRAWNAVGFVSVPA